jgi:thioredoxin-dependent peroxiredoxin
MSSLFPISTNLRPLVKVNEIAPNFLLRDQHDEWVSLSDYYRKNPVVLFFYPKDETSGCTAQVNCFKDNFAEFTNCGAVVIGISSDSVNAHTKFASRYNLPFHLLSDPRGKVRELYGVQKSFFLIPGRVTFVIDKAGIVRFVFSSQLHAKRHIDEAINAVRELGKYS